MATTEEAMVSVIAGDPACQTHLGAAAVRLYPLVLKQGTAYPAATYQQIAGAPEGSFDGLSTLNHPLIQVDCYALTLKAARDLANAIRSALDDAADLGAVLEVERTEYEPNVDPREKPGGTRLFRVSMDWSFLHHETT